MKTITLEGIEYNLVPVKQEKKEYSKFTLVKECMTDCGTFTFQLLLKQDGSVWEGTEAIVYKRGKANEEDYWDNSGLIRDWLNQDTESEVQVERDLPEGEINLLNELRDKVNELGW